MAPKSKEKSPELKDFLDEIKRKAFDNYQERLKNHQPGDHLDDWLNAEKEIKQKFGIKD